MLAWKTLHHFPEHYHYFSAHSLNFRGSELRAINKFTANYPGAEGMKTGFTCGSGFNLIGSAQQNGKRLIGVVMGGMTSHERYQLMMQKMDASFARGYGDPGRTIESMPTGSAGTPPYQLDCGNGAAGSYAAANPLPTKVSLHKPQYKHATPAPKHAKHSQANRSRVAPHSPRASKAVLSKTAKNKGLYKSASSTKPRLKTITAKQVVIANKNSRPAAKNVSKPPMKSQAAKVKAPLKVAHKSLK